MEQGLQRVLNLAKKTGDNVIVFDSLNPDNSYVILAINKYEDLLEEAGYQDFLTEEEMTDKINRDIEPWDITDDDWDPEDIDVKDFLPKHLFGEEAEDEKETADAEGSGESMEEEWEEDVNYLYPTEDEFTSLRTANRPDSSDDEEENFEPATPDLNIKEEVAEDEQIEENLEEEPVQFNSDFSSIGDLLEEKKNKGNVWEIPEERQV